MARQIGRLRVGDRVVVFTSLGGRFRRNLQGTVMVISTGLGRGERLTVLLDPPTTDGFIVLTVAPTEVIRLVAGKAPK